MSDIPNHVRIMDGSAISDTAELEKMVRKYAEKTTGCRLERGPSSGDTELWKGIAKRPDGSKYNVVVRQTSSSAGKNGADARLTLEFTDKWDWESHGWPNKKLELKFN